MSLKRKIIIGVHGLGNKPPKLILEEWWKLAILEGLRAIGKPRYKINFELVYWADILNPNPLNPNTVDEDDDLYLEHPYVPAAHFIKKDASSLKRKFLDYVEKLMDEVFLNDDLSINFSKITDKLIHRYFRDLESYYKARFTDEHGREIYTRDRIRERLENVLRKHRRKEILLIAHSMGSILTYDVLTQIVPDIEIDTFITIGSPLGIPIVISRISAEQSREDEKRTRLRAPENVKRIWYNMSDLDDRIAFNYNLSDDYDENNRHVTPRDFIVSNNYEHKGNENPHSSFGYLRTQEMGETIDDFIIYNRPRLINWILAKINNFFLSKDDITIERDRVEPG